MKFWKFRVVGSDTTNEVNPNDKTTEQFTVTLGELRDARGLPRDPKTDHYALRVEATEAERGLE